MTSLFLLAHQDDEIGVVHEIARAARSGEDVCCIYLTNGAWAGVRSAQRNTESLRTLTALGLEERQIKFLGTELNIPDGYLPEHLERCFQGLIAVAASFAQTNTVRRIIAHAWEGGHQDHDAGHILAAALAHKLGVMQACRQFPLYRMPAGRFYMTFAAPLAANGSIETQHIPLSERVRYLRLLANYRSQKRVILKLLPHIITHYVRRGTQQLQPISVERVYQAPNKPPMLYEKWQLYSYAEFRGHADHFLAQHMITGQAPPARKS